MKIFDANCGEVDYPIGVYINKNLKVINELAIKYLNIEKDRTKSINVFCMGSSGAIMAGIFANSVPNVTIIHIKKDGEISHTGFKDYEKWLLGDKINIIIDDFIISGDTLNKLYDKINAKISIDYLILGYLQDYKINDKLDLLTFKPKNLIYTYDRD